ncbi:MAG TPA: hypothetical protein VD768_07195 [Sphingomicrobium sp.]|nr:hypothetical protein [Sphingomicrobium sp.]
MKAVTKILSGAAGIAALVGMAAPAAAQYPGYYPGYNTGTNVIGQVLNSIINPYGQRTPYAYGQQVPYGYGQVPYGYGQQYGGLNTQAAVSQCSAAVQSRIAQQYSAGYGYAPYNNGYSTARVVNITRVEPRSNTTMRVRGNATSGRAVAYNPYGGYGGYNNAAVADLSFRCDVDYRGYVRDIDIDRRY